MCKLYLSHLSREECIWVIVSDFDCMIFFLNISVNYVVLHIFKVKIIIIIIIINTTIIIIIIINIIIIIAINILTDAFNKFLLTSFLYCQETIKGTERASPIYTLFHR